MLGMSEGIPVDSEVESGPETVGNAEVGDGSIIMLVGT